MYIHKRLLILHVLPLLFLTPSKCTPTSPNPYPTLTTLYRIPPSLRSHAAAGIDAVQRRPQSSASTK
ncbi:unnamed protein product [Periconia digitata]|uniref:Secreted protein n=1 Tax=Periconia digitata TaxID=1303443 RepID=A0A9W4XSN4_9PLEO|nr:unnamed protein product [Periconia digitata]